LRALATVVGLGLAGTGGVAGLAPADASVQAVSAVSFKASVSVDHDQVAMPGPGEAPPTLTYTIQVDVTPDGAAPVEGLVVVDNLPAGVTPKAQTSSSPVTIVGRSVRWSLGDSGFSIWKATLTVAVDDPASITGPLRNVVVATSSGGERYESTPALTTVSPPATVLAEVLTRSAPAAAPTPAPVASPRAITPVRELPRTGLPIGPLAILAVALLLAGISAVVVARSHLY
jgi:hypothetical protein